MTTNAPPARPAAPEFPKGCRRAQRRYQRVMSSQSIAAAARIEG